MQSSLFHHGFFRDGPPPVATASSRQQDTTTTVTDAILPDELWRHIFSYLVVAHPSYPASCYSPSERRQPHLAVLMRVSLRFSQIAAPLLYHTCFVDLPHLFFRGVNALPSGSERHSKLDLLNLVRRLELIQDGDPNDRGQLSGMIDLHGAKGAAYRIEGIDQRSCAITKDLLGDYKRLKRCGVNISNGDMSGQNGFMVKLEIIRILRCDDAWEYWLDRLQAKKVEQAHEGPGDLSSVSRNDLDFGPALDESISSGTESTDMYDWQVECHPKKWGLAYSLLELLHQDRRKQPLVICQHCHEGTMTLGSIPMSQTSDYFNERYHNSASLDKLRVHVNLDMDQSENPLPPYSCIVPGATNIWHMQHECTEECDDMYTMSENEDVLRFKPTQEAIVSFALSKHSHVKTKLTIYNLLPSRHHAPLISAVNQSDEYLYLCILELCVGVLGLSPELASFDEPRRFGPFGMYQISTSKGIELVDFEFHGLEVTFKDSNLENGDEECPACKDVK
ncbi:hypothetical protein IAU59_005630 [Kwoniella sp. CBS 9459]